MKKRRQEEAALNFTSLDSSSSVPWFEKKCLSIERFSGPNFANKTEKPHQIHDLSPISSSSLLLQDLCLFPWTYS
jgi:hypothetical protein